VAQPEGSHTVKVGVVLARQPGGLGAWLADGSAFEGAGAHALWVDPVADPDLDPVVLTAALAAVTFRALLIVSLPEYEGSPDRMLATLGRLSRGRLAILAGPDLAAVPAHVPAVPARVPAVPARVPAAGPAGAGTGIPVFHRIPGDPAAIEYPGAPGGPQRWGCAGCPDGREAFRATLLDAAERGWHGLLLPADPRLLDMLRNPDDPGYRHDLQLAQG